MTNSAVIHRVTALDLKVETWSWPWATAERARIDAHFMMRQAEKPGIWNGRVLLTRKVGFSGDRLSSSYFETDFASFLAWRDWGYPDRTVFNGFGMGALRASDGAFVLGEMSARTANAGQVYFPGGTPDPDDVADGRLDIDSNISRELKEETGLTPADYRPAPHWDCVVVDALVAIIRILDVDMPGDAWRARIEVTLARQE